MTKIFAVVLTATLATAQPQQKQPYVRGAAALQSAKCGGCIGGTQGECRNRQKICFPMQNDGVCPPTSFKCGAADGLAETLGTSAGAATTSVLQYILDFAEGFANTFLQTTHDSTASAAARKPGGMSGFAEGDELVAGSHAWLSARSASRF